MPYADAFRAYCFIKEGSRANVAGRPINIINTLILRRIKRDTRARGGPVKAPLIYLETVAGSIP